MLALPILRPLVFLFRFQIVRFGDELKIKLYLCICDGYTKCGYGSFSFLFTIVLQVITLSLYSWVELDGSRVMIFLAIRLSYTYSWFLRVIAVAFTIWYIMDIMSDGWNLVEKCNNYVTISCMIYLNANSGLDESFFSLTTMWPLTTYWHTPLQIAKTHCIVTIYSITQMFLSSICSPFQQQ